MFFLLRCAFWLGLVFLAMARDGGGLPFVVEWRPADAALAQAEQRTASGRSDRRAVQSLQAADLAPPWRGAVGG